MKRIIIAFLIILFTLNLLISSQSKPSRILVIENCSQKSKTTLTLIDSDGDNRYDQAVEKFCDNRVIHLPIVIQTKYKNDLVPEKGEIVVDLTNCKKKENNTCGKLKIAQGLMDNKQKVELSFKMTFFDVDNNVLAIARQKCNVDTLYITGAMCNIKWDEDEK